MNAPSPETTAAIGTLTTLGTTIWIFGMLIYFLPIIVAACNKKRDWLAIFLLNFFLGWTFIGWVIALVWAAKNDQPKTIIIENRPASEAPIQIAQINSPLVTNQSSVSGKIGNTFLPGLIIWISLIWWCLSYMIKVSELPSEMPSFASSSLYAPWFLFIGLLWYLIAKINVHSNEKSDHAIDA